MVEDRFVDPVAEAIDIFVRVNPAPDCLLVGQRLYRDAFIVAAHPDVQQPVMSGETVPAVALLSSRDGEA